MTDNGFIFIGGKLLMLW